MAQVEHELVGAAKQPLVLKHNAGNRIGILERVDAHVHGLVILGLAVQHRLHLGQGTGVQGVMVGLDIETSTGRCALDLEGLGVMQEEAPVLALGRHAKQRAATFVVAIGADRLAVDGDDAVALAQAVVIPHLVDKQAVLRRTRRKAHVPVMAGIRAELDDAQIGVTGARKVIADQAEKLTVAAMRCARAKLGDARPHVGQQRGVSITTCVIVRHDGLNLVEHVRVRGQMG